MTAETLSTAIADLEAAIKDKALGNRVREITNPADGTKITYSDVSFQDLYALLAEYKGQLAALTSTESRPARAPIYVEFAP
jgi:hypothetical protein